MPHDGPSRLAGQTVVVTAGGTREPLDPVRYLGNRSSGKMGNALAREAADRGAAVILVTTVTPPADESGITVVPVDTADEMHVAVRGALPHARVLMMAAAVADYRAAEVAPKKMKKRNGLTLDLVPTVDILRALASEPLRDGVLVVGFAAETNDGESNAMSKLVAKRLDLVVLNDVSRPDIGMGSDQNAVTVFDAGGVVLRIDVRPKTVVASVLLDLVEERLS